MYTCDLCVKTLGYCLQCNICLRKFCDACVKDHLLDRSNCHEIVQIRRDSPATKYQAESIIDDPNIKIKTHYDSIKILGDTIPFSRTFKVTDFVLCVVFFWGILPHLQCPISIYFVFVSIIS